MVKSTSGGNLLLPPHFKILFIIYFIEYCQSVLKSEPSGKKQNEDMRHSKQSADPTNP
jgi:hypothetical protein